MNKIYQVIARGGQVKMESADIIKEAAKTITIGNCTNGSAFGWRTRLSKEYDSICRTPREAIDAFIQSEQRVIESSKGILGTCRRNIEQAQALYAQTKRIAAGGVSDTQEG